MQTQDHPQLSRPTKSSDPSTSTCSSSAPDRPVWSSAGTCASRASGQLLLLDAGPEVGHMWRSRWDSLTLFTPAEYDGLPGLPFPAPAGSYPTKDEVADYLRGYATAFELPVRLNTRVTRLTKTGDTFLAEHLDGHHHRPAGRHRDRPVPDTRSSRDRRPPRGRRRPAALRRTTATPTSCPTGRSWSSAPATPGCRSPPSSPPPGRSPSRSGTRPPMLPQRLLGRDLFWWLTRLGLITKTADSRLARRLQNKGDLVIGTRWRDLARLGIQVRPRLDDVDLTTAMFADGSVTKVAAVVWATGFRPDYSWLDIPSAVMDDTVANERGITAVPGLSILGLPWLHTRGSALLGYVKDDAVWLAARILDGLAPAPARRTQRRVSADQHT